MLLTLTLLIQALRLLVSEEDLVWEEPTTVPQPWPALLPLRAVKKMLPTVIMQVISLLEPVQMVVP